MRVGDVIEMTHMGQPFEVHRPFYAMVVDRRENVADPNKLLVMAGGYTSGAGISRREGDHFFLLDRSDTGLRWEIVPPSDKLSVMIAAFALIGRVPNGDS
jgi:hypothetical protein